MKIRKKLTAALICAAIAVSTGTAGLSTTSFAEGKTMNVTIDGDKAITAENKLYRGAGMVSANNSSRLLLDYKAENPDAYWELINLLFGEDGVGINHLKIEMGADINSSSGTEPNVKRTEDEEADVTRGAGYQLAADAKTVNHDLTLDMLYWSEPLWVTNAEDVYAARYKWYKESLDAAYETYGLKFDYVSAVRNERAADTDWVKYLSQHLKSETDCSYDYSQIKIVAGEEVGTWGFAAKMLEDEELLEAVDVVGSHYTSWASDKAQELADDYGKELWFSEASSPMSYAQGTAAYDGTGSGLSDINGALDVANRIITMVSGGGMTLYEYQPAVAAYYDGVTYCQKQLILANEPWSGYYLLDSGFYMSLHFSQFVKKGWAYVDGACGADGTAGGDGHAIVDSVYSYMTATDTETGDYSVVITNTTDEPITYNFTAENLAKASSAVNVWETRGADGGDWNENYFKHIDTITPAQDGDSYTFSVTVKPYSMVTLSTLEVEEKTYTERTSEVLTLPYTDDYEYSDYADDYLASRGGAPRYTTDEGGAFEVTSVDGNNVLMQKITPETKSTEWGSTPEPVTNFGDDRWFNYSVSADVKFAESDNAAENYVGVGLRYNLADSGKSGWWIQLYEDGSWKLKRNGRIAEQGTLESLDTSAWNTLKIEAEEDTVRAYLNGELLVEHVTDQPLMSAGRAALYSSYNQNCFDNLDIEPLENAYVNRYDNTDECVSYTGSWTHNTMSSYKNYKRTISEGTEGSAVTIAFEGTGFAVTGASSGDGVISVKIDGEVVDENVSVSGVGSREVGYYKHGLDSGSHTAEITVVEGSFCIDGVEVVGGTIPLLSEKTANAENTDDTAASEDTTAADDSLAEQEIGAGENATDSGSDSRNESAGTAPPVVPIAVGVGVAAVAAAGIAVGVNIKKKKK